MSDLSVVSPNSELVHADDVFLQNYGDNWDKSRVCMDGIIISYTQKSGDDSSFSYISSGSWCPHYLIAAGNGYHPVIPEFKTHHGQIFQLVSESYRAFHCSDGVYPYSGFSKYPQSGYLAVSPDRMTIGISIVVPPGGTPSSYQLDSLSKLITDIHGRIQTISMDVGRRHLGGSGSLDPYIGTLDFSDESVFGQWANSVLNENVSWNSDGSISVIVSGEKFVL